LELEDIILTWYGYQLERVAVSKDERKNGVALVSGEEVENTLVLIIAYILDENSWITA
jgi:hypothetical protein